MSQTWQICFRCFCIFVPFSVIFFWNSLEKLVGDSRSQRSPKNNMFGQRWYVVNYVVVMLHVSFQSNGEREWDFGFRSCSGLWLTFSIWSKAIEASNQLVLMYRSEKIFSSTVSPWLSGTRGKLSIFGTTIFFSLFLCFCIYLSPLYIIIFLF
jgi:hypothetical protein